MAKMDAAKLAALVGEHIASAIEQDGSWAKNRRKSLEYRDGKMSDFPAPAGKSKAVSKDVNDQIGWIAPSLARVFLSAENIGIYEPQKEQDEPFASQATDYVNYVFMRDCNGYQVVCDALDDSLTLANGLFKHWWDGTEVHAIEPYTGQSAEQFAYLFSQPDIDPNPIDLKPRADELGNEVYDFKLKRITSTGRMRVMCLPDEEFLIDRNATVLDEESGDFWCHRYWDTRSSLIKQGYSREKVDAFPTSTTTEESATRSARGDSRWPGTISDKATERVEVYECYVRCDYDGDGVAELRKVVMAGGRGENNILENEEWGEDLPFTDIVPMPVPHRWRGRSMYDEAGDIQEIKTVLTRKILDNIYLSVEPQKAVSVDMIESMDEVLDTTAGGVIRIKGGNDIRAAIGTVNTPFVAKEAFGVIQYMDEVLERRTGVSRSSMALDPETLQNQTATAVNATDSASKSKIELYARNIAENGMTRLFAKMLKIIVKNQDRPRTIKLRNKWVEMDPRAWNANMGVMINTGLGAGSRDRDLQMLQGIKQSQELIISQGGPMNPIAPIDKYANTLRKMVEVSGIKGADQFFAEVTPEKIAEMQQQAAQPKPDPKMMEAQAKLQIEQGKMEANAAMAVQKAQSDANLRIMEARAKYDTDLKELEAKLQLQQQMQDGKLAAMEREAVLKAELREKEMRMEFILTDRANQMNAEVASRQADTNINRPGGE